jgi:predicted RNA-binding Zn-ribbon protein involved in translation (DUF1610 family)
MIEAIRAIALSCNEDIVADLRALADELEAKASQKTTKATKKKTPAKGKTPTKPKVAAKTKTSDNGEFKMNSSKVKEQSSSIEWRGNKWKPPTLPKEENLETPNYTPTPRDRPKNTMVEVTCKECGRVRKISSSLVTEFTKKYVCDKCIAGV